MCGRFSQTLPWSELVALYGITEAPPPAIPPRRNIAPTDTIAIVRRPRGGEGRELAHARWGLIPPWAKDLTFGRRPFNARAETVDVKPSFRQAFRARRCLIVADGFYEWQGEPGRKTKYFISVAGSPSLAFAGLWERWRSPEGETIESATIIVTAANAAIAPVHERMPVILDPPQFETWLDPATDLVRAKAMLVPYAGALAVRALP